jgi:short-chain fatty acids transporter
MFNFLFILLALVFHGSIPRFVESVKRATEAAYGIILQFPFYAGIFGIMAYTGLLQVIANWFVGIATPFIYPLIVMVAAGVINIFIPSSGGIWMVQGPPTIMAAAQLGVPLNRVAMAFTAGEVLTNTIQPFWALPLLGATKTEMRTIMGYCIVTTIVLFIAVALCYLYLPM